MGGEQWADAWWKNNDKVVSESLNRIASVPSPSRTGSQLGTPSKQQEQQDARTKGGYRSFSDPMPHMPGCVVDTPVKEGILPPWPNSSSSSCGLDVGDDKKQKKEDHLKTFCQELQDLGHDVPDRVYELLSRLTDDVR